MIKYSENKSGNQIFGVKLSPTRVVGGEAHASDAIGSENAICSVFKVSTSFVKISLACIPIIFCNCNSLSSFFPMKGNHLDIIVSAILF